MKKKRISPLTFQDCVLVEGQIYFVECNLAVLLSMNVKDGKIKYVDRIPNEMIVRTHLISKILSFQNILILIPARTGNYNIWFYDLTEKTWSSVPFENRGVRAPLEQFEYATVYKDELFAVGCYYPAVVCINLNSKKIAYYDIFKNNMQPYAFGYCEKINNLLYIPLAADNHVIVFDMQSKQYKDITIGSAENMYAGIIKSGEAFWLVPRKNTNLIKWDGGGAVEEYMLPYQYQTKPDYIFNGICVYKNMITICGLYGRPSLRFPSECYEQYEIINESYLLYKKLSNDCLISVDYDGKIRVMAENEIKEYSYYYSETEIRQIMKVFKSEAYETHDIEFEENLFMNLDNFLMII